MGFEVYSKGPAEGMVDVHELGKLFLSLGQKLSEEELKKMLRDLDMDSNQTLNFPDFLSIMATKMKDRDSDSELRDAFSVLDEEGTGYIKASELSDMLINMMGEKEDEVKGMLSEANVSKDGLTQLYQH